MTVLIFDLDGTLVDTVYAHVFAWQRAPLQEVGARRLLHDPAGDVSQLEGVGAWGDGREAPLDAQPVIPAHTDGTGPVALPPSTVP